MKLIDDLELVTYESIEALFPDAWQCEITTRQLCYGVDDAGVLWAWAPVGMIKEAIWQWLPERKEWGAMAWVAMQG